MDEVEITFLTVEEFAKALHVPQARIRDWIKNKRIKAIKIGAGKRSPWRIPKTEINRLHAQAYLNGDEDE